MTTQFALDYLPRRMRELGYGKNYLTRWRHIQLDLSQTITFNSGSDLFLLIEPAATLKVKSKAGTYDKNDFGLNELQYEHRGKIIVTNLSKDTPLFVLFIQVIPTYKK